MLYLNSDRIRVEIALPGEAPNNTSRFDRAGFVTEVTLDGMHRFCASEPDNLVHPSTGGHGLCCEYLMEEAENVPVDGLFPKIGVGLLRREDCPKWMLYSKKELVVRAEEVNVHADGNSAVFTTEADAFDGWAYRQVKTLCVKDNTLEMKVQLTNTGEKTLAGQEYCHNMLTIDGMALSPDYRLEMPDIPDQGSEMLGIFVDLKKNRHATKRLLRGDSKGFTFERGCPFAEVAYIEREQIHSWDGFRWKLAHAPSRAYVAQRDSYLPEKVTVWAVDHICSVESKKGIRLLPGETDEWTRIWTFGTEIES